MPWYNSIYILLHLYITRNDRWRKGAERENGWHFVNFPLMQNKISISAYSKVWIITKGLEEHILFILDTHFLEQCLTHNRHPINISRMNSSLSWPAIYVKAKGPGVFQAISFPKGPLSHYNFHKAVQFSGKHPRGGHASSNKSVCMQLLWGQWPWELGLHF